jgi:hypothetical protein
MNLVGKILVVALMVSSLVFASMTLALHGTHRAWKLLVSNPNPGPGQKRGLQEELADRDSLIARLQTELTEKQRLNERTVRESEQVRGSLESQNQELLATRTKLQTEITDRITALKEAITNANNSATVAQKTQEENTTLRNEATGAKKDRDDARTDVIVKEDELAQAIGEWIRFETRNKQLLLQLAQYRIVIQDANLPLRVDVPRVDGLVTKTNTSEKMVQINLGTDHGLKEGVVMDVFRVGNTAQYLGQIRLFKVDKTEAVGSVIPNTLKGTIQEDDHVATRIK